MTKPDEVGAIPTAFSADVQQLVAATLLAVDDEVRAAMRTFPPLRSRHEALAVLWEEFDEAKRAVFAKERNDEALRGELIQVAAMAVRALVDLRLI